MNLGDWVPDECVEYCDGSELNFEKLFTLKAKWCSETKQFQPLEYFRLKLDKQVSDLYTDLGGES